MKTKFTLNAILFLIVLFSTLTLKSQTWALMDSTFQQSLNDFDFFDDNTGVVSRGYVTNSTTNGASTWGPDVVSASRVRTVKFYGNSSTVFCGKDNGTIWKSTDAGTNWTQIGGYIVNDVTSLAFNGSNGIATDDDCNLAWSNDGGASWTKIPSSTLQCGGAINHVEMPSASVAYAGGANSIFFKSLDGGQTWTPITSFPGISSINGMSFVNTQIGFVSAYFSSTDSLFKTTDGGATWTNVSAGLGTHISDVFAVNGNLIFAGDRDARIHKSTDGGLNWTVDFTHPDPNCSQCEIQEFDMGSTSLFAIFGSGGTHKKVVKLANVVSGIDEIQTQSYLHLYPNPATNQLNINLGGSQVMQVKIYNVSGNLVSETKQPANNSLDISGLSKGVYIAEIKVGDELQRVRWVKM